jgi:hypothetical protein
MRHGLADAMIVRIRAGTSDLETTSTLGVNIYPLRASAVLGGK